MDLLKAYFDDKYMSFYNVQQQNVLQTTNHFNTIHLNVIFRTHSISDFAFSVKSSEKREADYLGDKGTYTVTS